MPVSTSSSTPNVQSIKLTIVSRWKTIISILAAVSTLLVSGYTLWDRLWEQLSEEFTHSIELSTLQLTKEIQQSTFNVVEMHRDDLEIRIRILKRDIDAHQRAGTVAPERLLLHLDALIDQLTDLKERYYQ